MHILEQSTVWPRASSVRMMVPVRPLEMWVRMIVVMMGPQRVGVAAVRMLVAGMDGLPRRVDALA